MLYQSQDASGYNPSLKPMDLKIFNQFSDIQAEAWDALLARNETDVPFLRYGYLKRWWEFKGGGEWPEASRLFLITGWEHDQLAAIAPLFSPAEADEERLMLLGSIEISDYLDILCPPDLKEEFTAKLLQLIRNDFKEISRIDLINIPQASSTIVVLEEQAAAAGWTAAIDRAYHTPVIRLADNWDLYLAGIDKKQRHEIRRKMRRAQENADSAEWYIVEDAEKLDAEIEGFFSLMQNEQDKADFLTAKMRAQMTSIMRWAFQEGYLQLSFLKINQEKAAGYFSFDYGQGLLVYNSGFDFDYSEFSPGWVLLAHLIQHSIETGKTHFDFMRGDEKYKYRFGAEDGFVMRALLTRA